MKQYVPVGTILCWLDCSSVTKSAVKRYEKNVMALGGFQSVLYTNSAPSLAKLIMLAVCHVMNH